MPTLNWLTRKDDIKVSGQMPYRILEPVAEGVYGEPGSGNLLIQGDNLDALKSLLPFYAGSVKCIFIDPPYNTRKDFEHYVVLTYRRGYPRKQTISAISAAIHTCPMSCVSMFERAA